MKAPHEGYMCFILFLKIGEYYLFFIKNFLT